MQKQATYKVLDYDPFGMQMPARSFTGASGYKFGFGNQEKENDISGIDGGHLIYKYRIHDARLGRFLSVDPLYKSYPYYSTYQFAGNDVIRSIDLEGLEPWVATRKWSAKDVKGYQEFTKTEIKKIKDKAIKEGVNKNTCFDCADFAAVLLIRYAAQNKLEVEFTTPDGSTINSSDIKLKDLDGKLFDPKRDNLDGFSDLVRGRTNAESLLNDMSDIPTNEPEPGDVTNNGFHVNVVREEDATENLMDGLVPTISGTPGTDIPGTEMNGTLIDDSRKSNVSAGNTFKRWNVVSEAAKTKDKIAPKNPSRSGPCADC